MTEPKHPWQDFMQEVMPGSVTFEARVLCPKCGWHFKDGLTDPSGETTGGQLLPGAFLICGQCLTVSCVDAAGQLAPTTSEQLAALPAHDLEELNRLWLMHYVGRALSGANPAHNKGSKQ